MTRPDPFAIPATNPAAHQGLPPARPNDPLRSPRRQRTQQPGTPDEPAPEPSTRPHALRRWC
ncbi:hypothetical protein [Hymenobacter sp. B81]|uniref:hypothetical protein n=1 Tax=Hymenobacter sp. B81 TaxID=3344878 RepID=UPI0037DC1FA1